MERSAGKLDSRWQAADGLHIWRRGAQARRSTRTRTSRRAAAALALREAQEPRFKLDENGSTVPDLRAEAAIIYSPETGKVLWEENAQDQRSIASITKIMTAAVFLENDPDLTREVVIQRADVLQHRPRIFAPVTRSPTVTSCICF